MPDHAGRSIPRREAGHGARCSATAKITGADIDIAIHATTLITNALIERKGARTALLSTAGFRDTLEMATEVRYDNYNLRLRMPEPLVPRDLRFDIAERMTRDGDVLVPLDADQVRHVARTLREKDVAAVAVVYLHGFRNPAHERETAAILAAELPGVPVSLSSAVAPEIREYERTSTTTANAYVQPLVASYLDKSQAELSATGYARQMYMMVSSGGIAGAGSVKGQPIRLLESGPTAGVLAAVHFGRHLGIPDLVTFDMGGTTAKIGLIKKHAPKKSSVFEFGRVARFMKGSGLPVKIPMIELIEIGAGGGSIAAVDNLGLLTVGPRSAGSKPGPACYGLGGTQPTVTDANVILGNLDPDYFLGGAMKLDRAAAEAAFGNTAEQAVGPGSGGLCARGVPGGQPHDAGGDEGPHRRARGRPSQDVPLRVRRCRPGACLRTGAGDPDEGRHHPARRRCDIRDGLGGNVGVVRLLPVAARALRRARLGSSGRGVRRNGRRRAPRSCARRGSIPTVAR